MDKIKSLMFREGSSLIMSAVVNNGDFLVIDSHPFYTNKYIKVYLKALWMYFMFIQSINSL